jgi:glycosyltransferase involved in cell wall biosynthesis
LSRAKVGIYCLEVIGKAMAGPAIRYWEFARSLSKKFDITLFCPNEPDVESADFKIIRHSYLLPPSLMEMDLIITQSISCPMAMKAKKAGVKLILDAYDPEPFEVLEVFKEASPKERAIMSGRKREELLLSFRVADGFICASEKQKDLWIGSLLTLGRITPQVYDQDPSLKQLIEVVPFGLSSSPPIKSGSGLRELFSLAPTDKIVLWGGGIWNWFDPLTLIHAMELISQERSDIKLVFMGIKHPNEAIGAMKMCADAIHLAKELALYNKSIFFNYGWVPYAERQNHLLEAEIGVSTHLNHLETRFSFRTRMLDYIWACLPIIGTTGDSFADLIRTHHLGIVVPFNDHKAIAAAIKKIIDTPSLKESMRENLIRMQAGFYWDHLVEPLEKMIDRLTSTRKRGYSYSHLPSVLRSYSSRMGFLFQEKGLPGIMTAIKNKMHRTLRSH